MATGYKNPPKFTDGKTYEEWKQELDLWTRVTELPKNKHAVAVSLCLEGKAREAALQVDVESLNQENGLSTLMSTLDGIFLRESRDCAYEAYKKFDKVNRESESIVNFLSTFDNLYRKCQRYDMTLPTTILAFKLLDSANLSEQQKQLALTACSTVDYDNMKSVLKRIFGNIAQDDIDCGVKIKQEVLYVKPKRKQPRAHTNNGKRGKNPLDKFGRITKCRICQSIYHWAKDCPEQVGDEVDLIDEDEENMALLTKNDIFLVEARNSAVIDTGCTRTVCGEKWLNIFMEDINQDLPSEESKRPFRFGSGKTIYSTKMVKLPAVIGAVKCTISTEVVPVDIPLLLSKESMKRAGTVLNLKTDTATMLGQEVNLDKTSSGHYCINIIGQSKQEDGLFTEGEIFVIDNSMSSDQKSKMLLKLHCQFGHASVDKIRQLMKTAGVGDENVFKLLNEVVSKCEACVKFKKPSPKPVVGLPLANDFNQTVAVDLHQLEPNVWYLHIIDEFSRFSAGCITRTKMASEFVDNFIKNWISIHGAPQKLFSDNGGEFNNSEVRDMAENFNIEVMTTPAYSPWSNGLLERHNHTLTEILLKIRSSQNLDWETSLAWALMAKNSLQNVHGFSPYQLVYGRNPNLPSVLTDKPPALEGITMSKKVGTHINAMYAAREAFAKAECSEKIRRALRKNTRSVNNHWESGDKVYYKRPDGREWKGPGIVIGTDGPVIFVRHGGSVVRVHQCRLQKVALQNGDRDSIEQKEQGTENSEESGDLDGDDEFIDEIDTQNSLDQSQNPTQEVQMEPVIECQGLANQELNQRVEETSNWDKKILHQSLKPGQIISYKHCHDNSQVKAIVMSKAGKSSGKNNSWFNLNFISPAEVDGAIVSVDLNKVNDLKIHESNITQHDSDTESVMITENVDMGNAKIAELESWKQNNVYTEVIDKGQKCISTRWVCTLKTTDKGIIPKARLVARGFEEFDNDVQKDSPTCAHESLRLIIAILAQRKWKLNSMDIKTAFLQGKPIDREVFVRPPKEANAQNYVWKLDKCVYGLSDASLNWYFRVKSVMLENGGKVSTVDPAVFYWTNDDNCVIGILASHVDDFIWGGTSEFETVIENIRSTFKVGKEDTVAFKYCGIELVSDDNGAVYLNQNKYTDNLVPIDVSASRALEKDLGLNEQEKHHLRSKVGQLLWLAHQSRPDLLFDTCTVANNIKNCTVKDMINVNKIISKAKTSKMSLKYHCLGDDMELHLAVFSDAALGNLPDGGSQGGYVIMLVGKSGHISPIWWSSKKIRRVVRSTLAAETVAMADGVDMCVFLCTLFGELFTGESNPNILQIECVTDCKSLYEAIKSQKFVTEKRLRIEISGIKELIENGQVKEIKWCESKNQLADCLTKKGASSIMLRRVLEEGVL